MNNFSRSSQSQRFTQIFFSYEGGRITRSGDRDIDCGIRSAGVRDSDHGQWECSISAVDEVRSHTCQVKKTRNATLCAKTLPPLKTGIESNRNYGQSKTTQAQH